MFVIQSRAPKCYCCWLKCQNIRHRKIASELSSSRPKLVLARRGLDFPVVSFLKHRSKLWREPSSTYWFYSGINPHQSASRPASASTCYDLDPSRGWNQLTLLCVRLKGWFSDGFCGEAQRSLWLGPKHCPDSIPQGQAVQCYLSSLTHDGGPLKPQRTCCVGLSSPWPHHRFLERRGRLQKRLIIMTPQQRMHLHTTGVYVLSLRGPLPFF